MTSSTQGSVSQLTAHPDASWRGLYRIGAVSAALYVLMIIVGMVLYTIAPQPPLTGGAAVLEYIASNKLVYVTMFISFVGLCLPAMVVFLALYVALKHLDKSYAALGALVGISSEIVALAYNSSPPSLHVGLLYLSDHYVVATTDAQYSALSTAAEALIAISNTINPAGILTALGILLISLPMLKDGFSRGIAYTGIATGVAGVFAEAFRDVIPFAFAVYGILLLTWFIAVGWKLSRLESAPPY